MNFQKQNAVWMDSCAHCLFLRVENYERLEADKKKQVQKKRRFEGPTIRYHSVLMPIVSHSVLKEENVDVEGCVFQHDYRDPVSTPVEASCQPLVCLPRC